MVIPWYRCASFVVWSGHPFPVSGQSLRLVTVVPVVSLFAISARHRLIGHMNSSWCVLNATVFLFLEQPLWLVTTVGVMKGLLVPSLPMLMVSSGFGMIPEWDSSITFMVNDGDAGWCVLLP